MRCAGPCFVVPGCVCPPALGAILSLDVPSRSACYVKVPHSRPARRNSRALRDIGEWVIREGGDGVRRPVGVRHGRAALARLGLPASQVLEDAPYDARIVDQGDHAHRPFTFRTFERICLVHLSNEPRPGVPWRARRTRSQARVLSGASSPAPSPSKLLRARRALEP